MIIPPWTILSGLGSLDRREMCDLLAVFDDAGIINIISDRVADLIKNRGSLETIQSDTAFHQRLKQTSEKTYRSATTDASLRLRLWTSLYSSFELESALPLSSRTANFRAAELAQASADVLQDTLAIEEPASFWKKLPDRLWSKIKGIFNRQRPDFSTVVGAQATRLLAEAAKAGMLDEAAKAELLEQVRSKIDNLPPELRDQAVERALKSGDVAALALLTSGTSMAGLAIAVELAGFSAYILAAQASAIVPLLGGKAAVSGLFVLSHPLFILPVLLGGGYLAHSHVQRSVRTKLAASLAIQMALKGLSVRKAGLQRCLDDFKEIAAEGFNETPYEQRSLLNRKLLFIHELIGDPLPPSPGNTHSKLDTVVTGDTTNDLEKILYRSGGTSTKEALVVASMTYADVIYDAVSINPAVIVAADFSRSADIQDVFEFGAFAEHIRSMPGAALTGAESNLQGYVAEQLVAARLVEQGFQVSLPATSNNPGYDLLVDGAPFQVKCVSDPDALAEHFEKFADIPVLVNRELAPIIEANSYGWSDKVFFVEGYDRETVHDVMRNALDAGMELDELDVPIFAASVSVARNLYSWWKGTLPLEDLPFEVVMEGAVKGSLAAAGGFVGSAAGLLIFGPAGAVVFSGLGGSGALFGSGWTRKKVDGVLFVSWKQDLHAATDQFVAALERAMKKKIGILQSKIEWVSEAENEHTHWLKLRMMDEQLAVAESLADVRVIGKEVDQPDRAMLCLQKMREACVHPWSVNEELKFLLDTISEKPAITQVGRGLLDDLLRKTDTFSKQGSWSKIFSRRK